MKNLIFILIAIIFLGCGSQQNEDGKVSTDVINVPASANGTSAEPGSAPQMTFSEEVHDFGTITQGEKVSYSFVFTNSGGSDLVISTAQGSCGCTVPSYPKEPIKPGQQSKIDVVFDSSGKSGLTEKTVSLTTNCNPSTKMLTIKSTILVPEEE